MKDICVQIGRNFAGPNDWRRRPMKLSLWLTAAGAVLMASALKSTGLDPDPERDIVALELLAFGFVMLAMGFTAMGLLSAYGWHKSMSQKFHS